MITKYLIHQKVYNYFHRLVLIFTPKISIFYCSRQTAFFGSRHVFALMGFLGLASAYMMRNNLSVAIVDMVKTKPVDNATSFFSRNKGVALNASEQCEDDGSGGVEVIYIAYSVNTQLINSIGKLCCITHIPFGAK